MYIWRRDQPLYIWETSEDTAISKLSTCDSSMILGILPLSCRGSMLTNGIYLWRQTLTIEHMACIYTMCHMYIHSSLLWRKFLLLSLLHVIEMRSIANSHGGFKDSCQVIPSTTACLSKSNQLQNGKSFIGAWNVAPLKVNTEHGRCKTSRGLQSDPFNNSEQEFLY